MFNVHNIKHSDRSILFLSALLSSGCIGSDVAREDDATSESSATHASLVASGDAELRDDRGSWQWQAGDPGKRKDPLAINPNTLNTNCFLTGVGGRLQSDTDYEDGAFIRYEPGISQYFMHTKNGKTGWSTCVR